MFIFKFLCDLTLSYLIKCLSYFFILHILSFLFFCQCTPIQLTIFTCTSLSCLYEFYKIHASHCYWYTCTCYSLYLFILFLLNVGRFWYFLFTVELFYCLFEHFISNLLFIVLLIFILFIIVFVILIIFICIIIAIDIIKIAWLRLLSFHCCSCCGFFLIFRCCSCWCRLNDKF